MKPLPRLLWTLQTVLLILQASYGQILTPKEVIAIATKLTTPFMERKLAAESFTTRATDRLMDGLNDVTALLDSTHAELTGAVKDAAAQAKMARKGMERVVFDVNNIEEHLNQLHSTCPAGPYYLNLEKLEAMKQHASENSSDKMDILSLFRGESIRVDKPELGEEGKEVNEAEAEEKERKEMADLLQPTPDVTELVDSLLKKYGYEATVSLRDFLTVCRTIARGVERQRLAALQDRLTKAGKASRFVTDSTRHVRGLQSVTSDLRSLVGRAEVVLGSLPQVVKKVTGVSACVSAVGCE